MIKIHLNSCFSTDFLLFPSSKTQSWPVGLVVMMVVGIGYLAVRNKSRSLYTVITFPNPHAKFPFASSSSFSSTFPLPWSLSPPLPLPLLCFHFLLLSLIFDPAETLRLQFLQLSQLSAVYIPFSTVSYPTLQPLVSPPCPLLLLLDYSPRLTLLWHTLSSQMKETLSDCFRGVWSLTRAHCASVCVCFFFSNFGLKYWRWGKRTNRVYLFWTLGEEESKICLWTINSFIITYWIYCSGAGYYHATMAWC